MKTYKYHVGAAVLVFSLAILDCMASPGLVGIINKCSKAEVWFGRKTNAGAFVISGGHVNAGQRGTYNPIGIPDTSINASDNKFDNSLVLIVRKQTSTNEIREYPVQIAQTQPPFGNHVTIQAKASCGSEILRPTTEVTTAANNAFIPGIQSNPWQGVVIAFADKAVADETNECPFTVALSSWASNLNTWMGDENHFLKINQTEDGSVQFRNKEGKPQYLNVIQGQQAFGGGTIPLPNHAHLVHIYNDTNRALNIKRTLGKGQGDSIIIPPYSVVPYIMAWIPLQTKKDAQLYDEDRPKIRISLIRQVKALDKIKIDEGLIGGAAGQKALPPEVDVDDILAKMGLSSPGDAASVLGSTSIEQLMKPVGTTKRYVSNVVYKIFADEDKQINIVSHDYSQENATDVVILQSAPKELAYIDYTRPGYFALVVTENPQEDSAQPIKLQLINLKTLKPPYIYQ